MTKQEKIKRLIEMQKKFILKEHEAGVSMKDYFTPEDESVLAGYREDCMKIAMEIIEDAHKEIGSKR